MLPHQHSMLLCDKRQGACPAECHCLRCNQPCTRCPCCRCRQVGKTIRVGGWVKTGREAGAGAFAFLEVNDGSCFQNIQVRRWRQQ